MQTLRMMGYILTKKEKLGFFFLFIGMLLSSLLEIVGLTVLVPVVNLVAYPDKAIADSWYLQLFIRLFHIPADNTRLLLGVVIAFIAVIYVLKGAYYIFFNIWQNKFVQRFSRRLSTDLFANYLYQPYEFHVYHNTSELISRATYDVSGFVDGLNNVLSTLSDILFCLITFIYLVATEWAITLIIFVGLGTVSVFLNRLFRKKARAYGREMAIINAQNIKAVREGLAGIKETKIANREQYFISVYDQTRKEMQSYSIKREVIAILPRTLVESMGMLGMLIGLFVYYLLGNPPEKIVATFTLLALAVVKLLPYISRIAGQLNSFRGAMYSIHRVYDDLRLIREVPAGPDGDKNVEPLCFKKEVKLKNITFKYKSGTEPVLNEVGALIPKGKSVAFCGKSGAGKTTTVDILLGLLKPQEGSVLCDDVDVSTNLNGWHKNLAYVPQDIYLIDSDIRSNVAFGYGKSEIDDECVWKALDKAQLGDFVRSLPNQLNTMIGEKGVRLSGGQRQRIGIARALYRDTPILVLDEATSALDFETEGEILKSVDGLRGEKTLVIITHRLNTIENCDIIYQIENKHMRCMKGEQ